MRQKGWILSMNKRHYIIPIFVAHRGCPHDCVFCNQKKITGQGGDCTGADVRAKIREYLATIPRENTTIEAAFYGGSFTAIPMEQQIELLSAVQPYIEEGSIRNIRISTRPDCIDPKVLEVLAEYKVQIVELGVQSMDPEVLQRSNRGHSTQDVVDAVKMLKKKGFTIGVQVMVGLPGDTEQKSLDTVRQLIQLQPDIARIYPALVIRNTYMEQMYRAGNYAPWTLEAAVEICKKQLALFQQNQIEVIRIGLQPTENILEGRDVVAGPFHPSVRQLVLSSIYKDLMEQELGEEHPKELLLVVHPQDVSDLLGQKRCNISFLKNVKKIDKIHIRQDERQEKQKILMKYDENTRKLSIKDFYKTPQIGRI
jgi:histone acetyltransferase (RNA polymerase elongator complex component)